MDAQQSSILIAILGVGLITLIALVYGISVIKDFIMYATEEIGKLREQSEASRKVADLHSQELGRLEKGFGNISTRIARLENPQAANG